jgi:hypothetical protein
MPASLNECSTSQIFQVCKFYLSLAIYNGGKYNAKTLDFSIYFSFAKYIVVGGTQSFLAKWKVHSVGLQSR